MQTVLGISVPTVILLLGVYEDLKTRKVRNSLVLLCLGLALLSSFIISGWNGVLSGLLGLAIAFALFAPLVALKIIGAGDMKLMMAFGLSTDWQTVFAVFVFALIWGTVLGVVRALISGQLLSLLKNTVKLSTGRLNSRSHELHLIPYTVALAFGWLSYLFYDKGGLL